MKKTISIIIPVFLLSLSACKKEKKTEPEPQTPVNTDNYSTIDDFYQKNGVVTESFIFKAGTGGVFISTKGTTVNIPANIFSPSTAEIKIEFKDIYKKSDMLLSKMPTNTYMRWPLKSAGEFFIRATSNDLPVEITNTLTGLTVLQPFKEPVDEEMIPFIAARGLDSTKNFSWMVSPVSKLLKTASNYVFNLFQFSVPMGSGTWCNSDNSTYFAAYPQTTLTLHPTQPLTGTDVFLVFKGVNSMVHVYKNINNDFGYDYAPLGLKCTVVAIGVKDGKLQSSFTPITIGVNQKSDFSLSETTTEDFKALLTALD